MDALAASEAASKGLTGNGDRQKDPVRSLFENMRISIETSLSRVITRARQFKNMVKRGLLIEVFLKWARKVFRGNNNTPPTYRPQVP